MADFQDWWPVTATGTTLKRSGMQLTGTTVAIRPS
jgi:hypothetical protein